MVAQHIETVDDLDGSSGAETVTFSLEGESYSIDLSSRNREKLHKALARFIGAATRVPGSVTPIRRGRRSRRTFEADPRAVRAWAESQGIAVSRRGRLSADVLAQFHAAGN
jgi:hypothetical protein